MFAISSPDEFLVFSYYQQCWSVFVLFVCTHIAFELFICCKHVQMSHVVF